MAPSRPHWRELQAGEDLALNELTQRHREPLFRFAFRYPRDETAARDVAQDTFVRVYFKAASFRPQSTVKTWLHTIAVNLCRHRLRRLGKHRYDIPLDVPGEDAARAELADTQPIPSEQNAQADRFKVLQRAIDQLPHRLKLPLVLCTLEGKSQQEAAEIMGTTPKAVELRIHHAKVKLRDLLGDLQR